MIEGREEGSEQTSDRSWKKNFQPKGIIGELNKYLSFSAFVKSQRQTDGDKDRNLVISTLNGQYEKINGERRGEKHNQA